MTEEFSVATAIIAAQNGKLEQWLYRFLAGPGNNMPMAKGLQLQQRWWIGPVQFPLSSLQRCCGPEPEMEFWIADVNVWERRINNMVASMGEGWEPPPLVVEYRSGILSVRDGTHRYEALKRLGRDYYWVIFWFNSATDKASFLNY